MKKIQLIAAIAVSFAMWGCGHTATEAINSDTELTPQSFGGSRWGSDKDPLDSTKMEPTASKVTTTSTYVATTAPEPTAAPVYTPPAATTVEVDTTTDTNTSMASSSSTTPAPAAPQHRRMKKQ
jgi:hypothetical protein